jgi:nucleotide-binding universal stress UspA family protein
VINIRTILYATDFSSHSNQAYFHAVALAEAYGATLIVAHVYTPEATGAKDEARRQQQSQLEQIRPVNPNIPVRHILLEGDPADAIIGLAADSRIDIIVMGTHGRTGLDRILMGSVAERVLRGAHCSVLVVKMPKAPSQKV